VIPVVIPEGGKKVTLTLTCVREDYDKILNKNPDIKYGGLRRVGEVQKIVPDGENFAKWTSTIEITAENAGEKVNVLNSCYV